MSATLSLKDLHAILPEAYLACMSLFLLMVAVYSCKRVCNPMLAGSLAALAGTAYFLWPHLEDVPGTAFGGFFATGGFVTLGKLLVLAAAALTVLISSGWLRESSEGEKGKPSEFLVLMLLSLVGMLLMISAGDLLTLYMALEMSSLALYVLAAFSRDSSKSSEAGLKYFTLGALASGMMLFGISLVYGFAGTTSFSALSELFSGYGYVASKALVVGMILILVGFCFKLSAVPFHMWSPDVYEGAPTPVTAFFATSSIAAMVLFTRLLYQPFGELFAQWQQIVGFVSVASMIVGSLAAIMQSNIKRLLAYSSIGHVGFMLMGVAAGNEAGATGVMVYLATYLVMNAGAFGCVLLMRRDGRYIEEVRELAGLSQTHPLRALMLSLFMFSMAGIPPLAGFFGKFYVIIAVVEAHLAWLAVIGVLSTVISAYYYLRIVKVMYFDEPLPTFDRYVPGMVKAGLAASAFLTMAFFLLPTPLIAQAKGAAAALLPGL